MKRFIYYLLSGFLVLGTCCDGRPGHWQGLEVIAKPFDLAYVVERVRAVAAQRGPVVPE